MDRIEERCEQLSQRRVAFARFEDCLKVSCACRREDSLGELGPNLLFCSWRGVEFLDQPGKVVVGNKGRVERDVKGLKVTSDDVRDKQFDEPPT